MKDEIVECPCYHICSGLGLETKPWCRYRKADLPPAGMHSFNPKDTWCAPGVQANVLMLGYLLTGETGDTERLKPVLEQIRRWAQALRAEAIGAGRSGRSHK